MATKTIQVILYACLLGTFLASGRKQGERNGRCIQRTEMSAGSLPRAPCRPNPCKERWIVEENSNTKTIGACENHWSCCSEDDQCVLSVIQCMLEISNDTNLEQPFCEDRGISVMPNDNCDITVDVSNFNSSNITSVTLVIEYSYNCTTQHYCHSTCQHYHGTREEKRRASHSTEPGDRCYNDMSGEDQADRYCSVDDMNTFKQKTTLEVLFPNPRLTLSECYNCICNESDNNTLTTSMNCNVTMACSLGLDSEVVKDTWVYFHFRNANTVRTVTAQCEPKKQDRSANYNWVIYRGDNFDCYLEIPQFGSDDIGEYECGIVDVSYTNRVNNVAKSEARNLLVVNNEAPIESQGSNLKVIVGSTVGGVGLLVIGLVGLIAFGIKRLKKPANGEYDPLNEGGDGQPEEPQRDIDPGQREGLLGEGQPDYGAMQQPAQVQPEHDVDPGQREGPLGEGQPGYGATNAQQPVQVLPEHGQEYAAQENEAQGRVDNEGHGSKESSHDIFQSLEDVERPDNEPDNEPHVAVNGSSGQCTIM